MDQIDLRTAVMLPTIFFGVAFFSEVIFAQQPIKQFDVPNTANSLRAYNKLFFVQVGAFRSKENAMQLQKKWQALDHHTVHIKPAGNYYRVRIGPMSGKEVARFKSKHRGDKSYFSSVFVLNDYSSQINRKSIIKSVSSSSIAPQIITQQHNNLSPMPIKREVSRYNDNWYLGVDVGQLKSTINSVTSVNNGSNFTTPYNHDIYTLNAHKPIVLAVEGGQYWQQDNRWFPTYYLGLRYQHLFSSNVKGSVTQYSLPSTLNYNYTWSVSTEVLSAYTKIDLVSLGPIMPYVNVGVGASLNRSGSYKESALSGVTPRISPNYAAGSQPSFTYDVGAGIDVALKPNLIFALGYDYQNLGALRSGSGQSTWSGERLNAGQLRVNTFLLGITYLFDVIDKPKNLKR